MQLLSNPLEAITSVFKEAFSGDTIETIVHTGIGFGASLAGSKLIYKTLITDLDSKIGRVGTTLGVSIIGSALVGMLTKDRSLTTRFLVGGLMGTLWQGISEVVRDTKAAEWIPTLGEGQETEEFRKQIEQEVLKELKGAGASEYLPAAGSEGVTEYIQPAGIEEIYLQPAGSEAYLTETEGEDAAEAGTSAYMTEAEDEAVTGVGEAFSEFSREALPERF